MRKNKVFCLIFTLICITNAFSQEWHFGVTAGYENTGATWFQEGVKKELRNISGFNAGPVVAYDFIDYFSLQSGLYFAMNGFETSSHNILWNKYDVVTSEKTILYYLQLPIFAMGKLPIGQVNFLLEAGPILSYGVASHTSTQIRVGNQTETYNSNDAFNESLYPFNCLIHLGAGAEISGARLIVGYNFGVFDIGRDTKNNNDMKTSGFVVSAAYLF
ncbi:MAG TPA: porin family protein [Candidatus Enterocola sp.]|nr:porin family protein [Candidatus Enterocola sp.]